MKLAHMADLKKRMLQWGHDKIVMEVHHSEYAASGARLLQWGHDKIVMEVSSSQLNSFYSVTFSPYFRLWKTITCFNII